MQNILYTHFFIYQLKTQFKNYFQLRIDKIYKVKPFIEFNEFKHILCVDIIYEYD